MQADRESTLYDVINELRLRAYKVGSLVQKANSLIFADITPPPENSIPAEQPAVPEKRPSLKDMLAAANDDLAYAITNLETMCGHLNKELKQQPLL